MLGMQSLQLLYGPIYTQIVAGALLLVTGLLVLLLGYRRWRRGKV